MTRPPHPSSLAIAIALALASANAGAQQATAAELEARIAELEATVQRLTALVEKSTTAAPPAAAAAPATPVANPIQATTITTAASPGTTFSYGGFIKTDIMWTDTDGGEIPDNSVGRLFYLPQTIPVGGADEGVDLDVHAQLSRFWFGTQTQLDSGDQVRSYFEADLIGTALGTEQATNTYGLTIRHAYVGWNEWLAGQTWSTFQDVAALPDAVDFIGPTEGTTFVRQGQIRYTQGPWSVALENPETTLSAFGGGPKISSDDNNLPDLVVRHTAKGDWGHFAVAGLLRQLKYEVANSIDESSYGAAVSLSGKYNLSSQSDLRYMVTAGSGFGRYIGLGLANDATLEANGDLEPLSGWAGFAAYRQVFSPQWRGNLIYSIADFDADQQVQGASAFAQAQSFHANLIYSPLAKLDVGAELIFGQREIADGSDGDLTRLHFAIKYSF